MDAIFGLTAPQNPQIRYKLQVPKNPVHRWSNKLFSHDLHSLAWKASLVWKRDEPWRNSLTLIGLPFCTALFPYDFADLCCKNMTKYA